ncbi:MAG: hypothetical protein K9G60_04075 [Pseudolabrys sp.]|nr:hypothetical protein [Pseudolabrys sp.]
MKTAIALAAILAAGATAQASLTPYRHTPVAAAPDVMAIYTGPAGAQVERDYFQAADRTQPCTVNLFVFTKQRLAQTCY